MEQWLQQRATDETASSSSGAQCEAQIVRVCQLLTSAPTVPRVVSFVCCAPDSAQTLARNGSFLVSVSEPLAV